MVEKVISLGVGNVRGVDCLNLDINLLIDRCGQTTIGALLTQRFYKNHQQFLANEHLLMGFILFVGCINHYNSCEIQPKIQI